LDRANAEYELTLKQIALEEAQQTANKMKLTRDAMGNYTYQYVADQDSIAQAEEELAAAENNLYNIDNDRTKTLVDNYYATMTEANEKITEAMEAGDMKRVERLREYYFGPKGMVSTLQSELSISSNFLKQIGLT
jgi:tRNA A37 N6-isopentenylltransferase MiaA